MSRRRARVVLGLLVVVAGVVGAAGPAAADAPVPLDDGSKGTGSAVGSPGMTFSLATTSPYWSAIVVKNDTADGAAVDYDMSIADGAGTRLAASSYGPAVMDFVAIDSNLRAPGPYLLNVNRFSSSGSSYWFDIWFRQRNQILGGALNVAYTLDDQWLQIRDVYLNTGDCLAVSAWRFGQSTGQMLLMASNPAKPVQGRGDAVVSVSYQPTDTGMKTLRYTATRAGWYGFVITNLPTGIPDRNTTVQYERTSCQTV